MDADRFYERFNAALHHYHLHGFNYCPTLPAWASLEAIRATYSGPVKPYRDLGYLVGSAEQSFVDCMLAGVSESRYMAITPCFRNETTYDELHRPMFFKLELCHYQREGLTRDHVYDVARFAELFFSSQRVPVVYVQTTETNAEHTVDLVDARFGIELGSYGLRRYKEHVWVYGTGLAEPRFSHVVGRLAAQSRLDADLRGQRK